MTILNLTKSREYLLLKNFVKASIKAIPPLVSVSDLVIMLWERTGADKTTASVLLALGARKMAYTFWPGTF